MERGRRTLCSTIRVRLFFNSGRWAKQYLITKCWYPPLRICPIGGGLNVSPASGSFGGVAGLVSVVGGVTSDVFGVGSSGTGSEECDGGGV